MQKRSVTLAGHRTSVSLEREFWAALEGIARARGISLQKLIESTDLERQGANLSSALRVLVLKSLTAASGG